ncbi:MAG: hydroxymethylbilane synthase [Akkermansiaceae bacterium]|nr:hydroxymethylbilane synthase [Armatimonadota bacterium]
MSSNFRLRLGTRGSALALWQARYVAERVTTRFPHFEIDTVVIKTAGDVRQDVPLSEVAGTGVFVKEIESALAEDRIDFAVHSAKDLPATDSPGLVLAAFCERGDPRDALIAPNHGTLAALPEGAVVATGSVRRQAQLLAVRPDLRFVEIRGNVDTRLAKLDRGDADALVLAVAGLARLGRQAVITETLEPETCLPQVGQACVAVQCRSEDAEIIALLAESCDYLTTRREVVCERRFLSLLGGGCTAPVAAHAISSDRFLYLFALVATPDGKKIIRTRSGSTLDNVVGVAEGAYQALLEQGAEALLSN